MRMNDADTRRVSTSAGYVGMDTETALFGIHAAHLRRGVLSAQIDFRSSLAEIGSRPGRLRSLAERLIFDTQCQR